jgi:[ribosomal protein S5]-alanine N-acetyltransferase
MIETERLRLLPCSRQHLETLLESESALAEMLGVDVEPGWLLFPEAVLYSLKMIDDDPRAESWGMHLIVHRGGNRLIGCAGYKGPPDSSGMVEFGYEVAAAYEGRGLATEAAMAFIEHAFADDEVQVVDAHTLAQPNASTRILEKCGLMKIAEKHDPEDGNIWQWRLTREDYEADTRSRKSSASP